MKYMNHTTSKFFRLFTVAFSKLMLCVLSVFSMMLFVAVAEGELNLLIGLALGLVILLGANAFCGVILPAEGSVPVAEAVQSQPMRTTSCRASAGIPLRVVRGDRVA